MLRADAQELLKTTRDLGPRKPAPDQKEEKFSGLTGPHSVPRFWKGADGQTDTPPSGEDGTVSHPGQAAPASYTPPPSLICSAREPWEPGALGFFCRSGISPSNTTLFTTQEEAGSDSNPGENPNTPLFIRLFQNTQKLNK